VCNVFISLTILNIRLGSEYVDETKKILRDIADNEQDVFLALRRIIKGYK